MRIFPTLIILITFLMMSCSSSESLLEQENLELEVNPLLLLVDTENPILESNSNAVAKVFRGNGFVQSGAFINKEGLFFTNYPIALEYFNNKLPDVENWIEQGFSAQTLDEELILPGVSLHIEVEQLDVSEAYTSLISENSSNVQIAQIKQQVTQEIVNEERSKNPDLVIQINELLNGRRYVLSKFKVLNDVRLVWAPETNLSQSDLSNSEVVHEKLSDQSIIVRAYVQDESATSSTSENKIPYQPAQYFSVTNKTETSGYAFGFPERSFRLDPNQALEFYDSNTNPFIIKSYAAFLNKEERLANSNDRYKIQSLANRVNIRDNLTYYLRVQEAFKSDSLISKKNQFDDHLLSVIQSDSLINSKFGGIFYFLNQAYEIANRQGATYYASSYFLALSRLDELALLIKDLPANLENDEQMAVQQLVNGQQELLSQISIEEELQLLTDFLVIFNALPDDQKPFIIQDIFIDAGGSLSDEQIASSYIQNSLEQTVLFDPDKLVEAAQNNTVFFDPIFLVLDELIFSQEMSRNNQAIFIAYAQPAKKVYSDAIVELLDDELITSDANSTMRINKGYVSRTSDSDRILDAYFNFTSRASGSVIIDDDGHLIGIISSSIPETVEYNYLYPKEKNQYKVIRLLPILESLQIDN